MKNDLLSNDGKASNYWSNDMIWYGAHGLGVCQGIVEYEKYMIGKLSQSFTNRSLEVDVLVCEGGYCGAHGYLNAIFSGQFLGEEPSNMMTRLRFGLHWHIDPQSRQIIEGYGLLDLPGFFAQSGIDLFKRAGSSTNTRIELLDNEKGATEMKREAMIYTTLE